MKRKSFTLVEILIVIVIIGILASALIPKIVGIQARARDAQRKSDLRNIATALELYRFDHSGDIPDPDGKWLFSSDISPETQNDGWIPGLAGIYINEVPVDPINNYPYGHMNGSDMSSIGSSEYLGWGEIENGYYGYSYHGPSYPNVSPSSRIEGLDGSPAYDMYAVLENKNDFQVCKNMDYFVIWVNQDGSKNKRNFCNSEAPYIYYSQFVEGSDS